MNPRLAVLLILGVGSLVKANASSDRLDLALTFPERIQNSVFRDALTPHWLADRKSFWYHVKTGPSSSEYVYIDATTGDRRTSPTFKGLNLPAPPVSVRTNLPLPGTTKPSTGTPATLTFVNQLDAGLRLFWLKEPGVSLPYGTLKAGETRNQPTFSGHVWRLQTDAGETLLDFETPELPQLIHITPESIEAVPAPRTNGRGTLSPDGRWTALIERNGVAVIELSTGIQTSLQVPLDPGCLVHGPVVWAPNSASFVLSAAVPVTPRKITLVESSPKSQVQPVLRTIDYSKPGDPLPQPFPILCSLRDHQWRAARITSELFKNAFTQADHLNFRWAADSEEFYFDYNERGHQVYRIIGVNAATCRTRSVVEEKSTTFIDYQKKTWRHWLDSTNELLWMSERDGWCHLWLYDTASGLPKAQITLGKWPVREVLRIDESKREIWFLASGLRASEDPYHRHLCRVRFDGSAFQQLTSADADHQIKFSPDREFFIARSARTDFPPVHELHRSADGSVVCRLEEADISKLTAAGWSMPERFVAKGRDGTTDIHGILIKPSHFDPRRKYPIVEEVYAGPHSSSVKRDFDLLVRPHQIAELGFVVVKADGMGTDYRGKVFHQVCWKNLKDAGFPDRIAWIKAAASQRPWMDLSRVGIFGGSAGGQNAMRALLDYNDFYQVAVADCGCHDNRMDKIWWNEQWMGWPLDDSYARSSNVEDAGKLRGQLLLIAGELDSNVDPASTLQVVGALQKAGRPFEFMPMVNTGHGAAETAFGSRLRMEFLLKHLLPAPPSN